MPRKSNGADRFGPAMIGLAATVALLFPRVLRAQAAASVSVQATVLSAEGTLAWQAVAMRLSAHRDGPALPPPVTLATIVEYPAPAEPGGAERRRVFSIEYLRN
ncbi:MAG: hypothetical protein ABJC74_03770 [Gemmatimonadota bacterium]